VNGKPFMMTADPNGIQSGRCGVRAIRMTAPLIAVGGADVGISMSGSTAANTREEIAAVYAVL
jgi:hypothetical protein